MIVEHGNLPPFLVPLKHLNLPETEIHLWVAHLKEISHDFATQTYLSWLQPEELEQWKRYQFVKSKHEFLMARVLMRTALSSYVPGYLPQRLPQDWRFQKNPEGRPFLLDSLFPASFSFSWSHAQDWVVGAFSMGGQVGVDVENLCRQTAILELAQHHFSEVEFADLLTLSGNEQRSRFFQYWTLKEAYSKARGMGLLLPLRATSFQLGPMRQGKSVAIQLSVLDLKLVTDHEWSFWLQELGSDYMIALAFQAECQTSKRPLNVKYYKFNIV